MFDTFGIDGWFLDYMTLWIPRSLKETMQFSSLQGSFVDPKSGGMHGSRNPKVATTCNARLPNLLFLDCYQFLHYF